MHPLRGRVPCKFCETIRAMHDHQTFKDVLKSPFLATCLHDVQSDAPASFTYLHRRPPVHRRKRWDPLFVGSTEASRPRPGPIQVHALHLGARVKTPLLRFVEYARFMRSAVKTNNNMTSHDKKTDMDRHSDLKDSVSLTQAHILGSQI